MQSQMHGAEPSDEDILKLLSNRLNLQILLLLSTAELYPREIARLLGRNETDISRRLNALRKIGLVRCRWKRIGEKNVKLCSSDVTELRIELRGVEVALHFVKRGSASTKRILLSREVIDDVPRVSLFVDRVGELEFLRRSGHVLVWGLPGMGKTALAAKYALEYPGPVFWYHVTEFSDSHHFLWRAGAFFGMLGVNQLLQYVTSGKPSKAVAIDKLRELASSTSALLVVDDLHNAHDRELLFLVKELARGKGYKLLITSRVLHQELLSEGTLRFLELKELGREALRDLLRKRGFGDLDEQLLSSVHRETMGIPMLVNMFLDVAKAEGIEAALATLGVRSREAVLNSIYSALSPSERQVLEVIAMSNDATPMDALTSVFGRERAQRAVALLIHRGIVYATSSGYLAHDLVRRSLRGTALDEQTARRLADYYKSHEGFPGLLKAMELYLRLKDLRSLVQLLRRRIESYSPEYLYHVTRYRSLLERVIKEPGPPLLKGLALSDLGRVELFTGSLRRARELLSRAVEILRMCSARDRALLGVYLMTLELLARVYIDAGIYDKALGILKDVIRMSADVSDDEIRSKVLFAAYADTARLYTFMRRYDLMAMYTELEYEQALEIGDEVFISYATMHLGYSYFENGMLDKAQRYLEHALELLKGTWSGVPRAHTQAVLARLYARRGMYEHALRLCNEALRSYELYSMEGHAAEVMGTKAFVLARLGRYREAEECAERLIRMGSERSAGLRALAYAILASSSASRGDVSKASTYLELLMRCREKRLHRLDEVLELAREAARRCCPEKLTLLTSLAYEGVKYAERREGSGPSG